MSDYVWRSAAEWAKFWEKASEAATKAEATADEVDADGGPTEADLSGEVDHGD